MLYKDLFSSQQVHEWLDDIARSKVKYKAKCDADGQGWQRTTEYSQQQEGEAQALK